MRCLPRSKKDGPSRLAQGTTRLHGSSGRHSSLARAQSNSVRSVCVLGVFFGFGASGSAMAQAGGGFPSLPAAGVDIRAGDLRQQLEAYQPGKIDRSVQPDWIISPSIGLDIGATDNALLTQQNRRGDVFTTLAPALVVSGATSRVRVNLSYSPRLFAYASSSSQTRIDQYFNGGVTTVIVPELLFLDLRGAITQQSRTGALGGTSVNTYNPRDQVQTITVSATPYAEHRFDGWGTGRVGYSILRSLQDARSSTTNFLNTGFNAGLQGLNNNGPGITGNLTTQRERGTFITGENLGRFNLITTAEAVQYYGAGAYHGAYRNLVSQDVGYAVTRTVAVVVGAGYQDLAFSGTPGFRLSEPIWNFGVKWTPQADTSISVGYARRDGASGLYLDATASPTARTRVFARYSQGLSTDSEDQQNLLQSTTVGSTGLITDSVTGAPVASTSSLFGTQNGLFRLRRFSVSGSLLLNRDAINVSVVNEDRSNISATSFGPSTNGSGFLPILPAGSSSNGIFGTVSWSHELTPVLTSTASVSYGTTSYSNIGNGRNRTSDTSITGLAALSYIFTPTLTGNLRYSYTERTSNQALSLFGTQGNYTENQITAGLRKSF